MASKSEKARERAERAAAALAAQKKKEQRRRLLSIGGVVVAIVVIIGVALGISLTRGHDKVNAPVSSSYELTLGKANAPHTVVIYEDFLCPYCDEFEHASRDDLQKLADEGKVKVEYRPFHLLPEDYSTQALNAFAVVKGNYPHGDVAKKFHDLLYDNQPSEQGPFPKMSSLVDLAVKAGADRSKVEKAIEKTDSEKQWTAGATSEAAAAGADHTPTVLLDGKEFQQGSSMEELAANLIKQLS